jgi:hypothetical protein
MSRSDGFSMGPVTPPTEKQYYLSIVIQSGADHWYDRKVVKAYYFHIEKGCFKFFNKEHKLLSVYPTSLAFIEEIEDVKSHF